VNWTPGYEIADSAELLCIRRGCWFGVIVSDSVYVADCREGAGVSYQLAGENGIHCATGHMF